MTEQSKKHPGSPYSIGTGTGVAGNFGGLPESYSSLDNAKVVILPVPYDGTSTYQKGADKGPAALIEASRNMELYDIETDSEVYTVGIHTAKAIEEQTTQGMLDKLYQQVASYLQQGKFVVTIGGEHSISQAPIRAHAERYPGLSVLQLDAHADLQPAYEGDPLSHASVMARVREIPSVSSVTAVGIRSMSSDELPGLKGQHTYFAQDLWLREDWIDDVVASLEEEVYITLDLDVFDPAIMPSTGTPEPGGLGWYQTLHLLKKVADHRRIVGIDIVELCPADNNKAPDFLAAKLVYKILSYIFKPAAS